MPYILLLIGIAIGLFALYRFMLNANVNQIRAVFLSAAILTVVIALFYLSVTGRLPAALALVGALIPLVLGYWRSRRQNSTQSQGPSQASTSKSEIMDEAEALEILGLEGSPEEKDIKAAYKKLMKKVHPDQEGSEWMASKLNKAKDTLLKK